MHTTTAKTFAKRLSDKLRKGVIKTKMQKQYYFNHVVIPYAEDGLWKFDTTDTKVLFVPTEVFDTPEHADDLKIMKGEKEGEVNFVVLESKADFIWDMKVPLHDFLNVIEQAYQDMKETKQLKYVPIVLDLTYLEPSEEELDAYHEQVKRAREGDAKAKQKKEAKVEAIEGLTYAPSKTVVVESDVLNNLVQTIATLTETNKKLVATNEQLTQSLDEIKNGLNQVYHRIPK
nr:MAG TPA: hypothetical protein [Caudoviricetes sp.]